VLTVPAPTPPPTPDPPPQKQTKRITIWHGLKPQEYERPITGSN